MVETQVIIEALKTGKIGMLGLDVYAEEENLFFQDLSDVIIQDDVLPDYTAFPMY